MPRTNNFSAAHRLTQIHNFTTTATGKENLDKLQAEEERQAEIIEQRLADGTLVSPFKKIRDLPYGFEYIGIQSAFVNSHVAMKGKCKGLTVISSLMVADFRVWYHVSFSRRDRLPNYEDIQTIKLHWFGKSQWAIQVFPIDSEHVNIAPNCLHLWSCVDPFPIPSFIVEGHI